MVNGCVPFWEDASLIARKALSQFTGSGGASKMCILPTFVPQCFCILLLLFFLLLLLLIELY